MGGGEQAEEKGSENQWEQVTTKGGRIAARRGKPECCPRRGQDAGVEKKTFRADREKRALELHSGFAGGTCCPPLCLMSARCRAGGVVHTRNRFAELEDHSTEVGVVEAHEINEVRVGGEKSWTRPSSMNFNLAGVCKPLVSAAEVVAKGNRVVLDPDPEKSCIENIRMGERMRLRTQKGIFVMDVKYPNGEEGAITLDS